MTGRPDDVPAASPIAAGADRPDLAVASLVGVGAIVAWVVLASAGTGDDVVVALQPLAAGTVLAAVGAVATLQAERARWLLTLGLGWLLVLAVHAAVVDGGLDGAGDLARAAALVLPATDAGRAAAPVGLWLVAVAAWGGIATVGLTHLEARASSALGLAPGDERWLRRATTVPLLLASALVTPVQPFLVGRLVANERDVLVRRRRDVVPGGAGVLVLAVLVVLLVDRRVLSDLDRWIADPLLVAGAAVGGGAVVALASVLHGDGRPGPWARRAVPLLPGALAAQVLGLGLALDRLDGLVARAEVALTVTAIGALAVLALDPATVAAGPDRDHEPERDASEPSTADRAAAEVS